MNKLINYFTLFLILLFVSSFSVTAKVFRPKQISSVNTDLKLRYSKHLYSFWVKYFTGKRRVLFSNHLKNGGRYYKLVRDIFAAHKLPRDLYYVGLIESGYNLRIRSRASAVGPWQFIKGTAKRYGLKVNRRIDERKNIIKSTHAAARYFKDLYNIFGSWELALCAYNSGEYRIIGAIRRGNTRDYRTLARKRLIPKETVQYISKVAAARELASRYRYYGFKFSKSKRGYTQVSSRGRNKIYVVKKGDSVYKIAHVFNVNMRQLREVNKLKNSVLITGQRLIIPHMPKRYRIRRGDNLHVISKKFGVSVRSLMSYNSLSSDRIHFGQTLLIPL